MPKHRWALLITALLLALSIIGCAEILDAAQTLSPRPVGEIHGARTVGQIFVASHDGLNRIDVQLATYRRRNTQPIIFHLRSDPSAATDIATITFEAEEVKDNAYRPFRFPPISDSEGCSFYFFFESRTSKPGDAITMWHNPDNVYADGQMYFQGEPQSGDLAFKTFYTYGLGTILRHLYTGAKTSLIICTPFALLLVIACGLGVRISRWLGVSYSSKLECCTFAIGLGMASFVGVGFALGSLGRLSRWSVLLSLGGMALIGLPALREANEISGIVDREDIKSDTRFLKYMALSFLFLLLVLNLIGALVPDTMWDAHSYHLDVPKRWLSAERMVYIPYILFSNWPLNLSVIYAIEMLLIDESILPQLTHFSLGVLSTLLIYCFVRSRYGSLSASFASIIFYSIPVVTWLSGAAICDFGVSYFMLFAVIAFLRWVERDDPSWMKMAALGAGLAMGTKLTGLFGLALLALSILYKGLSRKEPIHRIVYQEILASVIAVALALPWYVKSYVQTGNPIFPFAYDLFGGKYWTATVNTRFISSQFAFMGIGRSVGDYLLLPLGLLVPHHIPYGGPVSGIFLIGLLWGLAQRRDKTVTYLSVYAGLSFILWALFTSQQVRMLLPALGVLSIVAGIGIASLTQCLRLRKLILSLVMTALMAEGIAGVWRERPAGLISDQVSVVIGRKSREAYLREHFYLTDVLYFANEQLPSGSAILAFNEVRGYLSRHEFIWGPPSLQGYVDYEQLKTRDALRRRLKEIGAEYVLINDTEYPTPARELNPIKGDLKLVYGQGEVYLYRLASGGN